MDPLRPLIETLNADGRPRIWSLVITVFGDCVAPRGGRIATARLSRLLARVGVETGAVRTALSRLSQDGWVEGRRSGRTSSYALTPRGLQEFAPATQRIYAPPRERSVGTWVFDSPAVGGLKVAGGGLRPAPVSDAPQGMRITGALAPESAAAVAEGLDPAHRLALQRMAVDLVAQEMVGDTPLDHAAARLLLVHRWRRLILRWPEVPTDLIPADIAPRDLHRAMARAYARLTPGTEAWLNTAEGEMPAMPPASEDVARRFSFTQSS